MPLAEPHAAIPGPNLRLIARDLSFARDGERIFGPLSFVMGSGEILAIGGANGAGKTTLLQVLAGLMAPTGGSVTLEVDHQAGFEHRQGEHGRVALLGHLNGLKLELSPRANLAFRGALTAAVDDLDIDTALARAGLAGFEDLPLRELSAGQRRRVALAALARNAAPVWMLDEPFANLDAKGRALVAGLIERQRARRGMVALTTHGADALPTDAQHVRLDGSA